MDRRQFCKMAALSLGALGLSRFEALAERRESVLSSPMPADCTAEVIRRECFIDLQSLHLDDPESGGCPVFMPGAKFEFRQGDKCPEGFCTALWNTLVSVVSASKSCPSGLPLRKNTHVVSCPDGTRPLILLLKV
ncbi:MAG: TIGR04076 family protein [Duncaniella sp.]|nr:TIGR04076 family protein [Duncaniella sp.]